ncbi:MCU protein, partial [Leiothrix lutea]|nr:MCU protein [Leiothrix lutea]
CVFQVHQRLSPWQSVRVVYCSTVVPSDEVTVVYQNGLPVISVSLPSRRERCQFTLKPISDSVGVFLQQLQAEDRGIDRVAIYSADGTRVASSTGIDLLLLDDFKLIINDVSYHVRPPKRGRAQSASTVTRPSEQMLQVFQRGAPRVCQLHHSRDSIYSFSPSFFPHKLVSVKYYFLLSLRGRIHTLGTGGRVVSDSFCIALMSLWVFCSSMIKLSLTIHLIFSWFFLLLLYSLLSLTSSCAAEYVYPDARDRQYLLFFHKGAKKTRFDLEKYNQLKDAIAQAELDLKRLRDPLQVHLPIQQISEKD